MKIIKLLLRIILFCFLTLLTQIGGVVYLISLTTYKIIDNRTSSITSRRLLRLASFLVIYCLATFLVVPIIARSFGRVALPIRATNHLQPLNILTCLLNRHYVKPALKQVAFEAAG